MGNCCEKTAKSYSQSPIPGKLGDAIRKEDPMTKSPAVELMLLFSIVTTIVSIVFAIQAFVVLEKAQDDVSAKLAKNWNALPIIDVKTVSINAACPSGYLTLGYDSAKFNGVSTGSCACTATSSPTYTVPTVRPSTAPSTQIGSPTVPSGSSRFPSPSPTKTPTVTYSPVAPVTGISSATSCPTYTTNCYNDTQINPVNLNVWRRRKICFKSGGEAATTKPVASSGKKGKKGKSTATVAADRPVPSASGKCPSGYQVCGSGTYDKTRAICFPSSVPCPFTRLVVAPGSTVFTGPDSDLKPIPGASLDNNYTFFGRRGHANELPVVQLTTSLTQFTGGYATYNPANLLLTSYSANNNKMGPCYSGGLSTAIPVNKLTPQGSVDVYTNQYSLTYAAPNFGRGCSTISIPQMKNNKKGVYKVSTDTRYNLVDNLDLETFMLQSFEVAANLAVCAGTTLNAFNTSGSFMPRKYNIAQDPDTYTRGVPLPGIAKYGDSKQGSCSATDTICQGIFSQTECGRYVHAAHAMNRVTTTYGIYSQAEIYWQTSDTASTSTSSNSKKSSSKSNTAAACPPRSNILSQIINLKAAISALMAVMIVSVIVGFVSGIVGPIYTFAKFKGWVDYTEMHDEPEFEEFASPPLTAMKIIPVIAALVLVGGIAVVYQPLATAACSDALTNATFNLLATELPKAFNSSITNIVVDCLLLLWSSYTLIRKRVKSDILSENTRVDGFGRPVVRVPIPPRDGDKPISIDCFCATYTIENLPAEITEGTEVFLYRDGQVWGMMDARDNQFQDKARPQGFPFPSMQPAMGFPAMAFPFPMMQSAAVQIYPQQPAPPPVMVVQQPPVMVVQQQPQVVLFQQQQQQQQPQGYPGQPMMMQQQQPQGYPGQPMMMQQQPQGYPGQPMMMQQQPQGYPGQPMMMQQQPQGYPGQPVMMQQQQPQGYVVVQQNPY